MQATFTVRNRNSRAIKDFTVACEHSGPSGTVIDSTSEIIYEIVPAEKTRVFRDVNMGFINTQVSSSSCRITDLALD